MQPDRERQARTIQFDTGLEMILTVIPPRPPDAPEPDQPDADDETEDRA